MRKNPHKFTEPKRQRIVDEYLTGDRTAAQVAAKHKISAPTLHRWRREFYPAQPDTPTPDSDVDLLNRAGVSR